MPPSPTIVRPRRIRRPSVQSSARPDRRPSLREHLRDERGDVPGWVLITIMSAGIVAVLWPFAEQYLRQILEAALSVVRP
ncbi:hypothetical protein [Phytoactinopolyspora limicola]|uniref:hypothetical protein n=1 Tax=Phytoactinopolyspora limicola TaxID=2715536 RepID=UPI001408E2F9|nr:hypothetical protein [Phytoactinopolyspora limicola]